ncbi:hypothetical protein FRC12_010745 [Ceratobasidium sp. 428]|nr:hypothetical protein FRC12_010745 [Ceratobasidium sp. 428]
MSSEEQNNAAVPIGAPGGTASSLTAPTPVNTPLNAAPISLGLSRPTVPDIKEDETGEDTVGQELFGLVRLIGKLTQIGPRLLQSGIAEVLPAPVAIRVEGLKGLQAEYTKLERELKREMLELEKKYNDLTVPLYERRRNIISGSKEPTKEEIAAGEAVSEKDDPEGAAEAKAERDEAEKNLSEEDKAIKGVPNFWLTVLRNHEGLAQTITEKDEAALESLKDIRLEYLPNSTPGFKLLFDFAENPFFENTILEKTYHYQDELGYSGDYIYDKAVGTEIKWKEDKDLTKAIEIKKQRNKNTNRTRLIRRSHAVPSFFHFFAPPIQPTPEQIEAGEVDEDVLEELDEKLEMDYQIGEDLKERIIPRAVDYFTGKALEFEDTADLDDDDDYEDIDDDFEDDDDSDDDAGSPSRRARGTRGAAGGANAVDAEECKQQ